MLPIRHLLCAENTGFKKHLHGWRMWGEGGWSDRTAKVYAEVSSLKTSAIALHAVVFGVHEAPSSSSLLCSGRWLVGPFRTSNKLNKLFYLTRPQLALLKSLLCSDR